MCESPAELSDAQHLLHDGKSRAEKLAMQVRELTDDLACNKGDLDAAQHAEGLSILRRLDAAVEVLKQALQGG
jgi:hypothetical protein